MRRESSAAGCLELQHLEAPIPAIHRNATILSLYASELCARTICFQHRGAPDLDWSRDVAKERPRPYVRGEGPDQVVHLSDPRSPLFDPVSVRNLSSISTFSTVLFAVRNSICLQQIQTLYSRFSSGMGQEIRKFS